MSELENALYILSCLSSTENEDLEDAEIEVYYESENGGESSSTFDMPAIADVAIKVIKALEQTQIEQLKEIDKLKSLIGDVVNSRDGDINTVDGTLATVGLDELIHLESYFQGNG